MSATGLTADATGLAQQVREGAVSARSLVEQSLARITATEPSVNAFTSVLAERALKRAGQIDKHTRRAELSLAGVPFAVKNLFDIAGLPTLAGSKIEREAPPAARDALLVRRLEAAGAVLVGALNMDEYAYGFTTENSHYGPTRNPHDPSRIAGGSSGGSAAAIAAGQVPITLGSDTNGSIRVPSSLCGVFGLKPTYGRLPRLGSYPFVASLDHLGPFARSVADLAATYDAMQGPAPDDPACAQRPPEPTRGLLSRRAEGLRIAVLGGWFREMAMPEALSAVDAVAHALGTSRLVELRDVDRARAAAFLISNAEGANLHLSDLRTRAQDFEPLSRDRFLAGALLPPPGYCRRSGCATPSPASLHGCSRRSTCCSHRPRPVSPRRSAPNGSRSTASSCRRGPAWACSRSRSPASACRWSPCRCGASTPTCRTCRSVCR